MPSFQRSAALLFALAFSLGMIASAPVRAEPIKVYAAGSLRGVIDQLKKTPGALPDGTTLDVTFGPSGRLRQRIEAGAEVDLFLSADIGSPKKLFVEQHALMGAIPFARNRMCLIAKATTGLNATNVLATMLDPKLRVATSTPLADPGGDYAMAVFGRADAMQPGAGKILKAKARYLLGGAYSPLPGHGSAASIFIRKDADMLISYCNGLDALTNDVPDLVFVAMPNALDPKPVDGMAVLSDKPEVLRLALFILSEEGQTIISKAGLFPILDRGDVK